MKVFVTGTDGYVGSILTTYLATHDIQVTGLDTGYYRDGWLFSDNRSRPNLPYALNKDLRTISESDLEGHDAVVHLAELSNDPLGENNPAVTRQINYEGSIKLAQMARNVGIGRFVYASSCSVYGVGSDDIVSEATEPKPQTEYARCKAMVEQSVGAMSSKDFSPVFLRNATAYGPSPRMRFDIVLNDLCALAWTTKRIAMLSDGSPWRPVVHVYDMCQAIYQALLAPAAQVAGQVLNVGQNSENYRVRELAEIVAAEFPGCEVSVGPSKGDNRSYRVSFDRIGRVLPGFKCKFTARDGARQLHQVFSKIKMTPESYQFRAFTRLRQLKYLQETAQIDSSFFWT